MAKSRYFPSDYRQQEVSCIVGGLDQGQSVSVIGAPSVGKTNLLRFLDQGEFAADGPSSPWKLYAPHDTEEGPIVVVNIDPNALLPALPHEKGDIAARSWPGFELLIHRTTITPGLFPACGELPGGADSALADRIMRFQEHFENAHLGVTRAEDRLHAHLALRHLEDILNAALSGHALQGTPIRIAYFMDEFERLLETMPNYFFVALRSIRDRFKYKVMFVTFTRNNLSYLAGRRLAVLEPFIELFNDTQVYLGPFNDSDAWNMVQSLETRGDVSKNDYALGLVMRATGGFAGLLRAAFHHAEKLTAIQAPDYSGAVTLTARRLNDEQNVREECETLIRALNKDEIAVMYHAAAGQLDQNNPMVRELVKKSLLAQVQYEPGVVVMPPVLAEYVRSHPTPPEPKPLAPPATLPEL